MSMDADPPTARRAWSTRLRRARYVLLAAAILFAALAVSGALSLVQALSAFVVIAAAGLIGGASEQAPVAMAGAIGTQLADARVLDAAIAGLPDPVIVLDRQGLVLAFNARARAVAPALALGQPMSFALRIPDILDAVRRTAATGMGARVEFFERVPDRWSEAFIERVSLPQPTVRRDLVVVTLHDLTPIRRVEEMRADFVANASHELRTPLASLVGFIETLQGPAREDAAARERFLAIMKTQANRMARLIDDLLSLSRIELKAHLQPQTPVDLLAIVRQVADGLQMLARERGVDITLDLPSAPLTVRGDRDELIRVFENLIENALKYGATGKRVEVSGRREGADGAEAAIAVRDFGPGIAPEHLPRLTERFYRVDVVESRALGGTGLGLALVKHVLNRHRGRLAIDSAPGKGATFTVRLPLAMGESGGMENNQTKPAT